MELLFWFQDDEFLAGLFIVKIDSRSTGTVDAGLTQCFFL